MDQKTLLSKASLEAKSLKDFLKKMDFFNDPDLCEVEADSFIIEELKTAFQFMDMAITRIEYVCLEIIAEGTLVKNASGRYTLGEYEYTSDSIIEFLYYDDFDEKFHWGRSRIEFDGDYYIYNYKFLPLNGLRVRRRALPDLY